MPTSASGTSRKTIRSVIPRTAPDRGFTLIELLVVLIVLGLLVSLVGLNIDSASERRELTEVTRSLFLRMQVAADEAIISGREIGLRFDEGRYRFLVFDRDAQTWAPPRGPGLSGAGFPEWIETRVDTDTGEGTGLGEDESEQLPDIVFFSSGEITPFNLELWWEREEDATHVLRSDGVNGTKWDKPGDDSDRS